jgi:hypothetical protein
MDTITIEQCIAQVFQLKKEGVDNTQIALRLQEQNIPADIASQAIQEWKKIVYAKKRNQGFVFVGVGTALMVFSFLLSVFLFYSDKNIEWALYGITFVGLGLTFKGMVDILGW